jgi:hypothetical protein
MQNTAKEKAMLQDFQYSCIIAKVKDARAG